VQKKQARDAKLLKELKERRDKERKERADKRKTLVSNAEKYYKEYQNQSASLVEARRKAKNAGNLFVEPEAKLAFVIRTRG
jgi:large subunit ribosomal protein L7e